MCAEMSSETRQKTIHLRKSYGGQRKEKDKRINYRAQGTGHRAQSTIKKMALWRFAFCVLNFYKNSENKKLKC